MDTKGGTGITNVNAAEGSENKALLEAAKLFTEAQIISLDDGVHEVASVPAGRTLQSLKPFNDEYLAAPERKKGTARLTTLASFADHVSRHKDGDTVIFADDTPGNPKLLAVYDYNREGPEGLPRFGDHRAEYAFPLSEEWQAWAKAAQSELPQKAFADFLEDRIADVLAPTSAGKAAEEMAALLGFPLASPARLLELSRGLSIRVENRITNAVTVSTGEARLTFEETHNDGEGGELRVPGGFAIAIPVFRAGAPYKIAVRLRYRVERGVVLWKFVPHRMDLVFKDAIDHAVVDVMGTTERPVFYGTPER